MIDREYASAEDTREIHATADLPTEATRRVAPGERTSTSAPPSYGTLPLHRLEQEATIEQRHEALLLALIERGVLTRADYHAALKRLLSE